MPGSPGNQINCAKRTQKNPAHWNLGVRSLLFEWRNSANNEQADGAKMDDLRVHKFTYSPDVILAMDDDRRSAFLLLGLFLNEANWLQKLLIMGMPDERHDPEPELQSKLSLAILLTKLLAGKMHAGGERLRDRPLVDILRALDLSDRGRQLERQLILLCQIPPPNDAGRVRPCF